MRSIASLLFSYPRLENTTNDDQNPRRRLLVRWLRGSVRNTNTCMHRFYAKQASTNTIVNRSTGVWEELNFYPLCLWFKCVITCSPEMKLKEKISFKAISRFHHNWINRWFTGCEILCYIYMGPWIITDSRKECVRRRHRPKWACQNIDPKLHAQNFSSFCACDCRNGYN